MSSDTEGARQRLFFALWPPDDVRQALAARRTVPTPSRARPVPAGNLPLTLVFVGGVTARTRVGMEAAAGTVQGAAFELVLDCLGTWPGPGILWLAPAHPPPALLRLAADLEQALQPCGHVPESRAYRPHVTLARKLRDPMPEVAVPPLRWPVTDFVLVESRSTPAGPRYQTLRRWSLAGG